MFRLHYLRSALDSQRDRWLETRRLTGLGERSQASSELGSFRRFDLAELSLQASSELTSEQFSLLPARSDDDAASLGRFELAAVVDCRSANVSGQKFARACRLSQPPEEFDRIELGGIAGQAMEPNPTRGRRDVVAHQVAARCGRSCPRG